VRIILKVLTKLRRVRMIKAVLFFILILALCTPCFAQSNQSESLTITTYYPSPYGVYRNLRLHPSNVPIANVDRGLMYYDNGTDELKYWAGNVKQWVNLTGGGNGTGYWAEDTDHYIHNTNSKARVIVGGAGADNEEVLWVEGDMRVFHKPPLGDGNSLIYLTRNNTTNTATYGFTTYTGGDPGYGIRYFGNPGKLTIETGPPGWYKSITISNSSVGIGTEAPTHKLDVVGIETGVSSPDQPLVHLEGDGTVQLSILSASNVPHDEPEISVKRSRGRITAPATLVTDDEVLEIHPEGYTGAGGYPWGTPAVIQFIADGNFNAGSAPGRIDFATTQSGTTSCVTRMKINNRGFVGIGLSPTWTSPTHLLELGVDDAFKPGASGLWKFPSDARMKKNVVPLQNALEQMLRLRGIKYQWIEPEKHSNLTGIYMGMIAQDVEKVFPEWVSAGKEGYKNLNIIGFEALAVEAVRELKARNERLEERVSGQQEEIDMLKREIKGLKANVNALKARK
jgi:hypothetical protein